jgi:hypothetical protein
MAAFRADRARFAIICQPDEVCDRHTIPVTWYRSSFPSAFGWSGYGLYEVVDLGRKLRGGSANSNCLLRVHDTYKI